MVQAWVTSKQSGKDVFDGVLMFFFFRIMTFVFDMSGPHPCDRLRKKNNDMRKIQNNLVLENKSEIACEIRENSYSLCSTAPTASSSTVFSSHTTLAPASSHQPANSIFLSHHSRHQLQLQPSEQSDRILQFGEEKEKTDNGDFDKQSIVDISSTTRTFTTRMGRLEWAGQIVGLIDSKACSTEKSYLSSTGFLVHISSTYLRLVQWL